MAPQELILAPRKTNIIIFLILSLYPLVGMGIDLIAPSLPAISSDLNISSVMVKNLITLYLVGYALGNFCIGFLSDALGRRKLVLLGLAIFVFASLLPVFWPYIRILLLARFLQGFMIAAFAVIARAVLADVLTPQRLMRVATMVATMWGIGPVIGPVIGGYLQYYFNWQACFYFFAGFGLIGFIAMIFILPETHLNRQPLNFMQLKNNFKTIITHRIFMGSVILMGITYSLLIVFNTLGPFLIQTALGHTAVYFGHLALFMGLAFLLGTIICRRLVKQFTPEEIFSIAVPSFLLIALISLILAYLMPYARSLIIMSTLFMFLACGIIYPAGMGAGLALFRHLAGSGSAVMNLINILITSVTALFMSTINAQSAIPLVWIYFCLMLLCGITYYFLIKQKN